MDRVVSPALEVATNSPADDILEHAERTAHYGLAPAPSQLSQEDLTIEPLIAISTPSPMSSRITTAGPALDTASLQSVPVTASIVSMKSPRNDANRTSTIDIVIFSIGAAACILIMIGTKFLRRGWRLPAPVMGASSVAFFVLKNDASINPRIAWMSFAIWSTAALIYLWTAKNRLPPNRVTPFIIASAVFMGVLAYNFASVLQEPTATALPLFATFSTLVCKVIIKTFFSSREPGNLDPRLPRYNGHYQRQSLNTDGGYVWSSLSPV